MSTSKHSISLDRAKLLTANYRKNKKKILRDEYHNKPTLPLCETFDRDAFDELLARPDCVAVRFYYGMDDDMNVHLVFVGVDENNADIVPQQTTSEMTLMAAGTIEDYPQVYDTSTKCPPVCPPDSVLNTD
jgi:hypothetical protein